MEKEANSLTKNMKRAGVFNSILIVAAIVLELIGLFDNKTILIDYLVHISSLVALVFGFIYAFSGYKKDAAKHFKMFMFLFVLASLLDIIGEFLSLNDPVMSLSMLSTYANFIRFIILCLLAFIKNLGKTASTILSYCVCALSLFILVRTIIVYSDCFGYIVMTCGYFALSAVTCVFINAKYKDKAARGTK